MQIYVNGKLAALKKDATFEYVSENRLFSGSDDYTLAIRFPLKGCQRNIDIFGHINRADVEKNDVMFECDIVDADFFKHGSIAITEISEVEVKAQFLEGRSEQNFDKTLDDTFINQLDLGAHLYTGEQLLPENVLAPDSREPVDVALPWIENETGTRYNFVRRVYTGTERWKWISTDRALTWQPYLVFIIKRIAAAIGYKIDISALESDDRFKYLLICNSLKPGGDYNEAEPNGNSYNPGGTGSATGARYDSRGYADLMPKWSVKEFFSHLENLLPVQFDFDYKAKTISCKLSKEVIDGIKPVSLEKVIDEYSVTVDDDSDNCSYAPLKSFAYSECSHRMWKFYSCPWFKDIKNRFGKNPYVLSCESVTDFMDFAKKYDGNYLDYGNTRPGDQTQLNKNVAIDVVPWSTMFIEYPVHREWVKQQVAERGGATIMFEGYRYQLHPITLNAFGPISFQANDKGSVTEIPIVPAWLDFYNPAGEDNESQSSALCWAKCLHIEETEKPNANSQYHEGNTDPEDWIYLTPIKIVESGKPEAQEPAFDKLYLAWWNGDWSNSKEAPCPHVDDVWINTNSTDYRLLPFSLRLSDLRSADSFYRYDIDPKRKFTFKFICDSLPNPRALYIIKGKRYVCERLTSTFSDKGMSQLVKGEFWAVSDD